MDAKAISPSVQSVDRALDILEAIGRFGPIGVTELAQSLSLHVATVHNLLRTMLARHYLLNEGGRYRLGPAAMVLASRFDPLQALPELVRPALQQLARRTGEAASATVLVGGEAHLVGFCPGTHATTIHFPQWRWDNPLDLATGRVLVAFTRQADDAPLPLQTCSATAPADRSGWQAEFQTIRKRGFSLLRRPDEGQQLALGVPVWATRDKVLASLGLACPGFRATLAHGQDMLDALWKIAASLSRELGCAQPPLSQPHLRRLTPPRSRKEATR